MRRISTLNEGLHILVLYLHRHNSLIVISIAFKRFLRKWNKRKNVLCICISVTFPGMIFVTPFILLLLLEEHTKCLEKSSWMTSQTCICLIESRHSKVCKSGRFCEENGRRARGVTLRRGGRGGSMLSYTEEIHLIFSIFASFFFVFGRARMCFSALALLMRKGFRFCFLLYW